VVIVVVTIVIVLVSLAAYGFLTLMRTENKAAHARGDQLQAQAVAGSGREYLAAMLEAPRAYRPEGAETGDLPEIFGPLVVDSGITGDLDAVSSPGSMDALSSSEGPPVRQGRFCILAPHAGETGETTFRRGYVNESAKLNLHALAWWDRRRSGAGREALMGLPGMDEMTADAIMDWVDRDDDPRPMGAESEYYAELDPPRQPRNGPPESLEELLQVRGVTRQQLFGLDLNANFRVDDWESDLADQEATMAGTVAEALPWSHYLTVYSGERDESREGRPRIQLNQAQLGPLHSALGEVLPSQWADFIVLYRQFGRYRGSDSAEPAGSHSPDLSLPAKVRIRSQLDLIGAKVAVPIDEKKQKIIASPFRGEPMQMRDYLPKLMDLTTVRRGKPIYGRVNINLAPREVLLGLPGIDSALVERILSARTLQSGEDTGRADPTWLLIEGLVDVRQMRQLLPYVTTGGDVGRAQIIGFYDQRSPLMRLETVIDATDRPARQVYYKDLRKLGRGPLAELLQTVDMP
jgi:hypothetical protein